MSLKEFSGLENPSASNPYPRLLQSKNSVDNPHDKHPSYVGNLLDKFSNRRRASAGTATNKPNGAGKLSSGEGGELIHDSFDRAIDGINFAIREMNLESPHKDSDNVKRASTSDVKKPGGACDEELQSRSLGCTGLFILNHFDLQT